MFFEAARAKGDGRFTLTGRNSAT
ncbi:MAG: hypothetical protein R3A10_14185 [Caldilineaceae bacterium]